MAPDDPGLKIRPHSLHWFCFLDTTAFWENRELRNEIAAAADSAHVLFYFPETTIIERRQQVFERLKRAEPAIPENVLHERAEEEVQKIVAQFGQVVPTEALGDDVLRTITRALTTAGINIGFDDVVILLTSMRYAERSGFGACIFVSKNHTEFERAVSVLSSLGETKWLFVPGFERLHTLLRVAPDIAAKLQAFVFAQEPALLEHLNQEYKPQMVRRYFPQPVDDSVLRTVPLYRRGILAIPDELVDGSDGQYRVHIKLAVDVIPPAGSHRTYDLSCTAWATYKDGDFIGNLELEGPIRGTEAPTR